MNTKRNKIRLVYCISSGINISTTPEGYHKETEPALAKIFNLSGYNHIS